MTPLSALLATLDTRAFTSLWFWLLLLVGWWRLSGRVLGVPRAVVARARRALRRPGAVPSEAATSAALGELEAALWVGLRQILRPGPGVQLWAVGLGAMLLALLAVLGFYHRSELAQALFLLLAPQASAAVLSVAAARELAAAGVAGLGPRRGADEAADEAGGIDPDWLCARLAGLHGALRLIATGWLAVALLWGAAQVLPGRFVGF